MNLPWDIGKSKSSWNPALIYFWVGFPKTALQVTLFHITARNQRWPPGTDIQGGFFTGTPPKSSKCQPVSKRFQKKLEYQSSKCPPKILSIRKSSSFHFPSFPSSISYHFMTITISRCPMDQEDSITMRIFQGFLGRTSNTTLRILSVRGVPPPPLYGQNFR